MSEFIHEIAAEVSPLLRKAEEANETAIAAIADLIAGTVSRRREAGVCPSEAQPTILLLRKALSQAVDSNGNVLRAHGRLHQQYKTLASDDLHPFTQEGTKKASRDASEHRRPRRHLRIASAQG